MSKFIYVYHESVGISKLYEKYIRRDLLQQIRKASTVSTALDRAHPANANFSSSQTANVNQEPCSPKQVEIEDEAFSKVDLSFENAKEAFKSKSNASLVRTLAVFNLCSVNLFVDHNKKV